METANFRGYIGNWTLMETVEEKFQMQARQQKAWCTLD